MRLILSLSLSLSLSLTHTRIHTHCFFIYQYHSHYLILLLFSAHQYAEYAVQLQQEIHDAGYHVDVDESARTLNKKVMLLLQLPCRLFFPCLS